MLVEEPAEAFGPLGAGQVRPLADTPSGRRRRRRRRRRVSTRAGERHVPSRPGVHGLFEVTSGVRRGVALQIAPGPRIDGVLRVARGAGGRVALQIAPGPGEDDALEVAPGAGRTVAAPRRRRGRPRGEPVRRDGGERHGARDHRLHAGGLEVAAGEALEVHEVADAAGEAAAACTSSVGESARRPTQETCKDCFLNPPITLIHSNSKFQR